MHAFYVGTHDRGPVGIYTCGRRRVLKLLLLFMYKLCIPDNIM